MIIMHWLLNTMFGGDPSSVLFNEVREKQSLGILMHSQLDGKTVIFLY